MISEYEIIRIFLSKILGESAQIVITALIKTLFLLTQLYRCCPSSSTMILSTKGNELYNIMYSDLVLKLQQTTEDTGTADMVVALVGDTIAIVLEYEPDQR